MGRQEDFPRESTVRSRTSKYTDAAGMVRKRTLRVRFEIIDDFLRGFFAGADAIGDAYAVISAAGQGESRKFTQRVFDPRDSSLMADLILRHRVGMAPDAREKRLRRHAEQARQLGADVFFHLCIIGIE